MSEIYTYWISTGVLCLIYTLSAILYVARPGWVRETIVGLGYPAYLRAILIGTKLLAVAAILSRANVALSDLAYAGVFYHLLLSALAHIGVRKSKDAIPAAVGLVLLVASFTTQNAAREMPSPYAWGTAERQVAIAKGS
jgi:hypothetical protein